LLCAIKPLEGFIQNEPHVGPPSRSRSQIASVRLFIRACEFLRLVRPKTPFNYLTRAIAKAKPPKGVLPSEDRTHATSVGSGRAASCYRPNLFANTRNIAAIEGCPLGQRQIPYATEQSRPPRPARARAGLAAPGPHGVAADTRSSSSRSAQPPRPRRHPRARGSGGQPGEQ